MEKILFKKNNEGIIMNEIKKGGPPKGYKHTEEELEKIRNSGTLFKKGNIPWNKGIERPYLQGENAPWFKNGTGHKYQWRILKESGRDISKCQICSWIEKNKIILIEEENNVKHNDKLIIHHIDGNRQNNKLKNLAVLCHFCHNAIHDTPSKRKNRFTKGHEVPIEWRKKWREQNLGKKQSPETIQKRIETIRRNRELKLNALSIEST